MAIQVSGRNLAPIWSSAAGDLELRTGWRGNSRFHSHLEHLFFLVLRGNYRVALKDRVLSLTPGSVAYVPPGIVHMGVRESADCESMGVLVSPESLRDSANITASDLSPAVRALEDEEFAAILTTTIAVMMAPGLIGKEASVVNHVVLPLTHKFLTKRQASVEPEAWCRAQRYIADHLTERFSATKLSQIAGMSKSRLDHLFAELVGCGPRTYQHHLRSRYARTLLKDGLGIPEVATRCGYADQAHFTRMFAKTVGLTPGAFVRRIRRS